MSPFAVAVPLLLAAAPAQSAAPARPLLALRDGGRGVQKNLALRGGGRGVKPSSNKAGTSSVVGGVLLHLACGAAMATAEDTRLALLAQMAGMPLGPLLEKRAGPTGTALLATACIGTALAGKLGATDCVADLCGAQLSTVLLGLGIAVAYQVPLLTGSRWFPRRKGLVIGASLSGVGASAALFSSSEPGSWPLLLGLIGALLQSNPPTDWPLNAPAVAPRSYLPALDTAWTDWLKRTGADKFFARPARAPPAAPSKPTVVNAVFSWRFALLWVMIACSAAATGLTASTLKLYADKHETAKVVEMFPPSLTAKVVEMFPMAAALSIPMAAALGNALGRLLCGALSDGSGFKAPFVALHLVLAAVGASVTAFTAQPESFAAATVAVAFITGGTFSLVPAQLMRSYGDLGASVYALLFSAFGCAALGVPLLLDAALKKGGFVYPGLAVAAAALAAVVSV